MKDVTALCLGLAATLFAQDESKDKVERPVKECARLASPEKFDLAKTGIEWHKGIESALNQKKPILLLQILGNYDEVYC